VNGQGSAFARPELQLQIHGVVLGGEAYAFLDEASAILADVDTQRLAHEMTLADVEQTCGGAIHLENRRVWPGDHTGIRHLVEQIPVLRLLVAQLRLQFLDPMAMFDQLILCEPHFREGGAQFRERTGQQRAAVGIGVCATLQGLKTLKRRDESEIETIDRHGRILGRSVSLPNPRSGDCLVPDSVGGLTIQARYLL